MAADLSQLHPDILPLYTRLVTALNARGYACHATTTWRSAAAEDSLSSDLTSVTSSTSKHCWMINGKPASKAFDLGFFNEDGSYVTNGGDERYTIAGSLWLRYAAEKANIPLTLVWGGEWKKPHDPDHFQIA